MSCVQDRCCETISDTRAPEQEPVLILTRTADNNFIGEFDDELGYHWIPGNWDAVYRFIDESAHNKPCLSVKFT